MKRKPPRYDLPKAAPEPLRQIQLFVNTIDISHDREWLTGWFEEHGLPAPADVDLDRARAVREAIRELLYANNHAGEAGSTRSALETLGLAADQAQLTIDFSQPALGVRATGLDKLLGELSITSFAAMTDGSWRRLKCCRNHECRWAFYDHSKNRSATWCSMQICGNRTKIRTYREHAHRAAHPDR